MHNQDVGTRLGHGAGTLSIKAACWVSLWRLRESLEVPPTDHTRGPGREDWPQFSYGWVMLCANSVLILGTQRSAAMALWSNKDMNMQTSIGHFHGKGKGNWGKWVAAVAWWSLGKHLKGGHIQAEVPASICPEDKMWKNSLGNAKNISNTKCRTK